MQPMEAAFQSAGIGVSIGNRCNVASTLFAVADFSTKTCWRKGLSRYLLRGSPRTRPVLRLGTFGGMRVQRAGREALNRAQRPVPLLFESSARSAEHRRRQPAQPAVRPYGVIVDAPSLDDSPTLGERGEDVFVEAFVAQPAVERFDEAALGRLAGRNVVPFDATVLLPAEDGTGGQFGAVVTDQQGPVTPFDDAIELASDTGGRSGGTAAGAEDAGRWLASRDQVQRLPQACPHRQQRHHAAGSNRPRLHDRVSPAATAAGYTNNAKPISSSMPIPATTGPNTPCQRGGPACAGSL
jgi:hypothetical protein